MLYDDDKDEEELRKQREARFHEIADMNERINSINNPDYESEDLLNTDKYTEQEKNDIQSRIDRFNEIAESVNPTPKYQDDLSIDFDDYNYESEIQDNSSNINNQAKSEKHIFQAGAFSDGYQTGDIARSFVGTTIDLGEDLAAGVFSVVESILNIGANIIASFQDVLGFDEEAKTMRQFASIDKSGYSAKYLINTSPLGKLYYMLNETEMTNPLEDNIWEKNSFLGEYGDQGSRLIGYTAGIALGSYALGGAGAVSVDVGSHTLELPTLAIAGGASEKLAEANAKGEDVTELERWTSAISGGIIEGTTEGMFGLLGVGGNDITNKWIQELSSKASTSAGKLLIQLGIQSSGEALEELASYAGNYVMDNVVINNLGEADFSSEWNWEEVGEQMALAFATTAISGSGGNIIKTNSAIETAEEQLGRKLTSQEKAQVTQAVIDAAVQEENAIKFNPEEKGKNVGTFYTTTIDNTGNVTNIEATLGKQIDNPNSKVNISPVIIRNEETNTYNVIDGNTGVLIDSSPYETLIEAQTQFSSKMINLDNRTITDINNKVAEINVSLQNKTKEVINNVIENVIEQTPANKQEAIKKKQLEIINSSNPMRDDIHTGIRSVEDIKTLQEALNESELGENENITPDLKKSDIESAIKNGKITVYSSYPIKQGVFITPSKMEAQSYAGNGQVYSKEVDINDIAWIDTLQGQYAKINSDSKVENNGKTLYNNETEDDTNGTQDTERIDKRSNDKTQSGRIESSSKEREERTKGTNREISSEIEQAKREVKEIVKENIKDKLPIDNKVLERIINNILDNENASEEDIYNEFEDYRTITLDTDDNIKNEIKKIKNYIKSVKLDGSRIKNDITDYERFRKSNFGKLRLGNDGMGVDVFYKELLESYPGYFDTKITNPSDQLLSIAEWINETSKELLAPQEYKLTDEDLKETVDFIKEGIEQLQELRKIFNEDSIKSSFNLQNENKNDTELENDIKKIGDISSRKSHEEISKTPKKVDRTNTPIINISQKENNVNKNGRIDDFGEKIGGARKDLSITRGTTKTAKEVIHDYTVNNTENGFSVNFKGKVLKDGFKTQREAEEYIIEFKNNIKDNIAFVKENNGVLMSDKKYSICIRNPRTLKIEYTGKTFDNKEDAENYALALSMYLKEYGKNLFRPEIQKITRENPNNKNAERTTGDNILNNFGFRGGEFGNWVTQKERQQFLNYAQDAFTDLAEALGVEAKSLGQNKAMGIAFGARGKGLSAAVAHFEPIKKVINMTRLKGAGSLAHEYGHSIDNYLSRIGGYNDDGMATSNLTNFKLSNDLKKAIENVKDNLQYSISNNQEEIEKKNSLYEKSRLESLKYHLSHIDKVFRGEATTYKYNRKTKQREQVRIEVTKEQQKEYQKIKNILENGEITGDKDSRINRKTLKYEIIYPEPIEKIREMYKEVVGRKIDDDTLHWIYTYGKPAKQVTEVKSQSAFYKSAVELDRVMGRKAQYFSKIEEMWARAFESYVSDKLQEKGITDTYLVHSVYNEKYALFNPYPAGEERKNINKAFDNLIDVMKTEGYFKGNISKVEDDTIQGLENYSRNEIKKIVNNYIQEKIDENVIDGIKINELEIIGSRNRKTARNDSDLDIVVEYEGDFREDDFFDILNENPLEIEDIKVDINPINKDKSGSLKEYLKRSNLYDEEIKKAVRKIIQTNSEEKPKTVYKKYINEFKEKGYIDLNNKKVDTGREVAELAQIFRNPNYETFRILYTKDNVIVGQEAISSKIPNQVSIFNDKDMNKNYYKIRNRMERLNANGYYLLHNHPSGRAVASQQDIQTTFGFIKNVKGFKSHIIINSGTYANIVLSEEDKSKLKAYNEMIVYDTIEDEAYKTDNNPMWMDFKVNSDKQLAKLAHDIKNNPNYSTLIYIDAGSYIRIMTEFPNKFFNMRTEQLEGYIRNIAKQNGATRAFLATESEDVFNKIKNVKGITDAILYSVKDSEFIKEKMLSESFKEESEVKNILFPIQNKNEKKDNVRAMKINKNSKARTEQNMIDNQGRELSKEQQNYFKDSKIRDEKGNLLVLYHNTDKEFYSFDINKIGKNTDTKLYGIYLSSKPLGVYGDRSIEAYANIINPVTREANKINYDKFNKLLKGKYSEKQIENGWRYYKNTNDLTILEQVLRAYQKSKDENYLQEFYKNVKDITGYDGAIYSGKQYYSNADEKVFVAFNSNQIKNIDNKNPTKNDDIRYDREKEQIDKTQRNAERKDSYIESEINKIEESGKWDNSIPVTRLTDIRKTIEDYLGLSIKKGKFRQHAYAIYKENRNVIRTREYKDMDSILHEVGHALDLGKKISIDKQSISTELLAAINKLGGYEDETLAIRLDEGFAEVIREYSIVPEQAKNDYPKTVAIIEGLRVKDKSFNDFITKLQNQTYNYIHQNPRNRLLSNQSIGEQTDKTLMTKAWIEQEVMRNIWDKDYAIKKMVQTLAEKQGKTFYSIKASENAYYLTRLSSGIGQKVVSILTDGYIDESGNKIIPGLSNLGEILENNPDRFNDLRSYLAANSDLDYINKELKSGMRKRDSAFVREQFKNDKQIQEAAKLIYDTLDGVLQYTVNNGLITKQMADGLRKSNAFYVPMQRVIENRGNQVGKRGTVADIIKQRTGSELDTKDLLENIITNSANMIQQVENNNVLKALYKEGEASGLTGAVYDVISPPVVKVGTAKLELWKGELKKQGVNIDDIDFDRTIDLFVPNNKVDTKNLITNFINEDGKRIYLQFNDEIIFNSLMNLDKDFMSKVLQINSKMNMPLRYGATMANIGFAIPNMISDTAQAMVYSTAGFIPIVDNALGVLDILAVKNKRVGNFLRQVAPDYANRINFLYTLYEQSGATSATRLSQYRKTTQEIMKNIYGAKNSKVLGIEEKFKPLKKLLDIMTYIPELSEQSTRFEVFKKNYDYYKTKGNSETDARILAALESRDATQDFGRTGNITREINQLIPFSAARVGSAYTFVEKIRANPKQVGFKIAILTALALAIKAIGYDDKEIEELNQRKKDDNFVMKIGSSVVTIKKPQGILRSIINLAEYIQDLTTGHIEEGKEGERLGYWIGNAIMDNAPADEVSGLVPNMVAPLIENKINKDFYYNTDIVKSYDLDLPDYMQYYDYNSQIAIWLGRVFNYSPAKIDNLISGYFGGLGTQVTGILDYLFGKMGLSVEKAEMGAEQGAIGKRFIVNVNSYSESIDEIYNRRTELTKKKNGGTITDEETEELEIIQNAITNISAINKQIKAIKQDLKTSGKEKAELIRPLQEQKTDTARQALGKELIHEENAEKIEATRFYPTKNTLSLSGYSLELTEDMKKEYEKIANDTYQSYKKQGLYSEEYLTKLESKCKDYAKKYMMQKYKNQLIKSK